MYDTEVHTNRKVNLNNCPQVPLISENFSLFLADNLSGF